MYARSREAHPHGAAGGCDARVCACSTQVCVACTVRGELLALVFFFFPSLFLFFLRPNGLSRVSFHTTAGFGSIRNRYACGLEGCDAAGTFDKWCCCMSCCPQLGLSLRPTKSIDVHIHFPSGAIPKDVRHQPPCVCLYQRWRAATLTCSTDSSTTTKSRVPPPALPSPPPWCRRSQGVVRDGTQP